MSNLNGTIQSPSQTESLPERVRPPIEKHAARTVEFNVGIPVKYSEELKNKNSAEFKALKKEMLDLFSAMLADEIENGSELEIDVKTD